MRHIVVEDDQVFQWDGHEWQPILMSLASSYGFGGGKTWLWPDRATARANGFIPPSAAKPPADAGGWIAVADRLPAERRYCAVTDGKDIACRLWNHRLQEWIEFESAEYPAVEGVGVTHWLPLPLALPR
jgi:hypothetical protein